MISKVLTFYGNASTAIHATATDERNIDWSLYQQSALFYWWCHKVLTFYGNASVTVKALTFYGNASVTADVIDAILKLNILLVLHLSCPLVVLQQQGFVLWMNYVKP